MARNKSIEASLDLSAEQIREDQEFVRDMERTAVSEFVHYATIKVFKGAEVAIINEHEIEQWKRSGWSTTPGK